MGELDFRNEKLGEDVLGLSTSPVRKRWVRRRVEFAELLDDRTVRRNIELHLDIGCLEQAAGYPASVGADGRYILLPVVSLGRATHTTVSLTDSAGLELPRFTLEEERTLYGTGLAAYARRINSRGSSGLEDDIRGFVEAPFNRQNLDAILAKRGRTKLARHDFFRALATDVGQLFCVLSLLPVDCPGGRTVVRLSFLEESTPQPRDPLIKRFITQGSATAAVVLQTPGIMQCASYHLEVKAPADVRVRTARLNMARIESLQTSPERETDRAIHPGVAHLHYAWTTPVTNASARVVFENHDRGVIRQSVFAAGVISAVMLIGLAGIVGHELWPHLLKNLSRSTDSASATSLLLVVPGIIAGYIARPGEHALTSWTLLPARAAVAMCSIGTFIAAGAVALHFRAGALIAAWGAASALAWIGTAKLSLEFKILVGRNR